MAFSLELDELSRRSRWMRRYPLDGVEPVVRIDGLTRQESFAEVERRCAAWAGTYEYEVFPTTNGTLIQTVTKDWKQRVHELAEGLHVDGFSGVVTAPTVPLGDVPRAAAPSPGLYLAHLQVPPITEGPFNDRGAPIWKWRTPEPASTRIFERLVEWVLAPDLTGFTNGWRVPVTAADALDIFGKVEGLMGNSLTGWTHDQSLIRRTAHWAHGGLTTWVDEDQTSSQVERAHALTEVLCEFASEIYTGCIRASQGMTEFGLINAFWGISPRVWQQQVFDANPIQILTSTHLERAHDLSSWNITEVSADRYLVTATDLEPWFTCDDKRRVAFHQFPDRDLVAQARADFGDMIYHPELLP
jgi:hypothetical protein